MSSVASSRPSASSKQRPTARIVGLYCRVSSDEQAEAETIEVQRDFLRRYCELHGLQVAAEYLDDGIKGTVPFAQRPAGSRLLEDARAGRFDTVLFMRVNRLARRLIVALDAYQELESAGVTVKSGTEPIDTGDPVGRFVFQLLGAFAELDRETIIDNTTRGKARGARNGRWYGVVPLGLVVRDGRLAPNEGEILPGIRECDLVRDIFERIADGSTGVREVARLAGLGVQPFVCYTKHDGRETLKPVAGGWTLTRITRMVRNSVYKGVHLFQGRQGDIPQETPVLVPAELWARANRRLTDNRRLSRRNSKHDYLLRGLIRCGVCGAGYRGTFVAKSGRRYYRCGRISLNTVSNPGDAPLRRRCRAKAIPADWLECEIWRELEGFLRNPGRILEEARRQYIERQVCEADAAIARKTLVSQLAAKDRERQTIITMARRGILRPDEVEGQLEDIACEQRELQAELDVIANRSTIAELYMEQARSVEAVLGDIGARLNAGLDEDTRREVVQKLVVAITVETEGEGRSKRALLRVTYRFADPVEVRHDTAPTADRADMRRL